MHELISVFLNDSSDTYDRYEIAHTATGHRLISSGGLHQIVCSAFYNEQMQGSD